jgi:hypothetical protein
VHGRLEKFTNEPVILIFRDDDFLAILHFSGAIIGAGIALPFADLFFGRRIELQSAAIRTVAGAAKRSRRSGFDALAVLFCDAELISARKNRDKDMFVSVILHGETRTRARVQGQGEACSRGEYERVKAFE